MNAGWRMAMAAAWAALGMASGALASDPRADALYASGTAKYGAADYAGAIKDAEAAVQLDLQNWQAWQLDGNARYAMGDQAGALTVYKYSLQVNPNNPQLKAFVDSMAGAAAAPAAAATPQASPAEVAYEAALAQYNAASYDTAMQGAAAAVRADPNHWQAWQLLGNCRYARADKRGALEAYDKSLALHPDNPGIRTFADSMRAEVAASPPPAAAPAVAAPAATLGAGRRSSRALPPISVGVWGGYGTVSLKAWNTQWKRDFDDSVASVEDAGLTVSDKKLTTFSGGMIAGVEGGYLMMPGLVTSARIGYLSAGTSEANFKAAMHEDLGVFGSIDQQFSLADRIAASLILLEGGGRMKYPLGSELSVSGGLFVGLGIANATQTVASSQVTTGTGLMSDLSGKVDHNYSIPTTGIGYVVELLVGAACRVSPSISVGADLGYRLLKVPAMMATRNVDVDEDGVIDNVNGPDVRNGEVYKDDHDNDLPFDLSGLTVVVAVTVDL
ncbi:MAG: hypothetical protein AAB152_04290 [Candidatus Coatesbacteria bacterium]